MVANLISLSTYTGLGVISGVRLAAPGLVGDTNSDVHVDRGTGFIIQSRVRKDT